MTVLDPAARVRRLVLDISPLMALYLLFQSLLCLFLNFLWLSHPFGSSMLMSGVLLAINGSMIAPRIPVWRMLPVTARDIDRARWWHGVGGPALLLALLMALPLLALRTLGRGHAPWSDIVLTLGGQCAVCVALAVVWMAIPLARRKWGSWSSVIVVPLMLIYLRIAMVGHGDMRPGLIVAIPIAIAAAAGLYLAAGHWPLPLTTATWAAPSGAGGGTPSRLSGSPVLLRANLPLFLWLWGIMAFVCLVLKYALPGFDLSLFGWMLALMSAQFAVTNLATGMRAFRALPIGGAGLTAILLLLLLAVQCVSMALFALVLRSVGNALPAGALVAPLLYPLFYFPATLRFGMRVAQFGYALSIMVIVPLQLMSRNAAAAPWAVGGLAAVAALAVLWTWHEIARGSRAYRVQPLVPARWRGVE